MIQFHKVDENEQISITELDLLEEPRQSVVLTCHYDKTFEGVHYARLQAKGDIYYGLSLTISPGSAMPPIKSEKDLQLYLTKWLVWYTQENRKGNNDRKNRAHWDALHAKAAAIHNKMMHEAANAAIKSVYDGL